MTRTKSLISVLLVSAAIPTTALGVAISDLGLTDGVDVKLSPASAAHIEQRLAQVTFKPLLLPNAKPFVETNGPTFVEWQAESGSNIGGAGGILANPGRARGAFVEENGPTFVEWQAESGSHIGGAGGILVNPGRARGAFVEESGPTFVEWQAESGSNIGGNNILINPGVNIRDAFGSNRPISQ